MHNLYLLFQLEEQSKHVSQKEDVAALKRQIYDLSMVRITFSLTEIHFLLDCCSLNIIIAHFCPISIFQKCLSYLSADGPLFHSFNFYWFISFGISCQWVLKREGRKIHILNSPSWAGSLQWIFKKNLR